MSTRHAPRAQGYPHKSDGMNKEFFTNKEVLVMGLGRFGGGVDVVKFTRNCGAKVTVTDSASARKLADSLTQLEELSDIQYHLGSHDVKDFERADIIVVNPAVRPDNEFLKIAQANDKYITSQINIFFQLCPAITIGITGANGKSTTAALTNHLLKAGISQDHFKHRNVWLSGNIGNKPLLTVVDRITADDLVVLELSSFQIEQLAQIKKSPHVALLTNLTPNHLDRYGTFEAYCAAKENIFMFQKTDARPPAVSIFNAEDKIASDWFDKYSKEQGRVCIKFSPGDVSDDIRSQFCLPGRANLSNLAAAVAIARHFAVDDESVKTCLPEFKALPHRLELVAEINGVRWYNDSKATTPESAIAAMDAFDVPEIIIAGGYDKHVSFDELGEKIAQKAKAAILIGQTAKKIASSIRSANAPLPEAKQRSNLSEPDTAYEIRDTKIMIVNSLAEAVERARELAVGEDIVLLSPACASYDMFDNFEQRGQEFIGLVRRINT